MKAQRFNPDKHKGLTLYEIHTIEVGDVLASFYSPSDVPFDVAKKAPWFFYVKDSTIVAAGRSEEGSEGDDGVESFWTRLADVVADVLEGVEGFGGPGSGHWGHKGVPGQRGGSSPRRGGIKFAPGTAPIGPDITTDKADAFFSEGLQGGSEWSSAGHDNRVMVKDGIVSELADRTGLEYEQVNRGIEKWSHTSNDKDPQSLALQKAVADEFGVPLSSWQQDRIEKFGVDEWFMGSAKERQQFVRGMYDNTQNKLRDAGFDLDGTIRMRRGVALESEAISQWKLGDTVEFQGSALESWSTSHEVAAMFAEQGEVFWTDRGKGRGIVIEADIPVKNIVGSAKTGFGCLSEAEFVALGSIPNSKARIIGIIGVGAEWED